MFWSKKENTFFYVYKDMKGVTKQDIIQIIWNKNDLRNRLKSKWVYVEKIYNLENLKEKAINVYWSKNKLLNFTSLFRLELEKGKSSNVMSEKQWISWVMKMMFDPVIYYIYTKVSEWKKFKDIIVDLPQIFDPVYVWIVEWFFGKKYEPIEWLTILEDRIKEWREYKEMFIKKSSTYLWAIFLTIIMSFVLDIRLYDTLVEEYAQFWRSVPDFTIFYHHLIWGILQYFPLFVLFVFIIIKYITLSYNILLKVFFSKTILWLPIIGKIIHTKSIYDFINIYYLLKQAKTILPREILRTTANALPSFYYRTIFLEIYDEILGWKNIWKEMQEYDAFNDEQDVIKVFEGSLDNMEELKANRDIYRRKLDKEINKNMLKWITIVVISAITLFFCVFGAYFVPIQQKSWLFKQQLNDQKLEQSLNNR